MPKNWYQLREGHYAQVIAMGVWLVVATIISLAYTSQLLSSLTAKEYEPHVDYIDDVISNNYDFLIPKSFLLEALKKDPRPAVQLALKNQLTAYPFKGFHPPWVIDK